MLLWVYKAEKKTQTNFAMSLSLSIQSIKGSEYTKNQGTEFKSHAHPFIF